MTLRGTYKSIGLAIAVLLVSLAVSYINTDNMAQPFTPHYELSSPSGVFLGNDGRQFIIDGGKKKLLVIDTDGRLKRIIKGERTDKGFYYASLVCSDQKYIYVADTVYAGKGTQIKAERILTFDDKGRFVSTVYEIVYEDEALAPLQYGNILSLKVQEDALIFAVKTEEGLEVIKQNIQTGNRDVRNYRTENIALSDVTVDTDTMTPIMVSRTGDILLIEEDASIKRIGPGGAGEVPWRLDYSEGFIYYTDLSDKAVKKLSLNGSIETVYENDAILYALSVMDGKVFTTDYGIANHQPAA